MQMTMQNNAAVFRTGQVLKEGVDKMYDIYSQMENLKVGVVLIWIEAFFFNAVISSWKPYQQIMNEFLVLIDFFLVYS